MQCGKMRIGSILTCFMHTIVSNAVKTRLTSLVTNIKSLVIVAIGVSHMTKEPTETIDNFSRSNALATSRLLIGLFRALKGKGVLSAMDVQELFDEQKRFLSPHPLATDFQIAAPGVIDHLLGEIMR